MNELFPITSGLKFFKGWGEYFPSLHLTYVDKTRVDKDFPIVWFEEMIHRSCFDWSWLKYRFPFATFQKITEFQSMVNNAKRNSIILKPPLNEIAENCPEWLDESLTKINKSYEVDKFYLKTIDPFYHALFLRIYEDIKMEAFSEEEMREAEGQYMNIPEDFRDIVQMISPDRLDDNKVTYTKYKDDVFIENENAKRSYNKLVEIEERIPNSKDYNRIIFFIMNPAPILPPIIDSPVLSEIKENPKYNPQIRFDIVSDIVNDYSEVKDWDDLQGKIEKGCGDTFLESLSRPRDIESLLKKYSENIPGKKSTQLFSTDDFNLLVLYPPYQHSLQIDGDDIVFNITLSILNIINRGDDYAYIWPKFIDQKLVSRLLQIFIINNWIESVLTSPNPICLAKIKTDMFDCSQKCESCFISLLNQAFAI